MSKGSPLRNGSGYVDKTAYAAMQSLQETEDEEYERKQKVLDAIFAICEAADFHIEERIVIRDKRSGRIWR